MLDDVVLEVFVVLGCLRQELRNLAVGQFILAEKRTDLVNPLMNDLDRVGWVQDSGLPRLLLQLSSGELALYLLQLRSDLLDVILLLAYLLGP